MNIHNTPEEASFMEYQELSRLGGLLSRDYSHDFFRLLVMYEDIAASEAASRLDLHIKTAQDFLEELVRLGYAAKTEVSRGTRPYFRYRLVLRSIQINYSLDNLYKQNEESRLLDLEIRERENSSALFNTSARNLITHVVLMEGEGRRRKEHRLSVTERQGRFLFHLPFPRKPPMTVSRIMKKAGLKENQLPEISDLVDFLVRRGVVESINQTENRIP